MVECCAGVGACELFHARKSISWLVAFGSKRVQLCANRDMAQSVVGGFPCCVDGFLHLLAANAANVILLSTLDDIPCPDSVRCSDSNDVQQQMATSVYSRIHIDIGNSGIYPGCPLTSTGRWEPKKSIIRPMIATVF